MTDATARKRSSSGNGGGTSRPSAGDDADDLSIARPGRPGRWSWLDPLAVLVSVPSLLASTASWWWIGELFVHFRMPYAIALAILSLTYLLLRRWAWMMAVGVVLAVNINLLWPLYAARPAPSTGEPLRVMVANVYIGNQNPEPVLKAVRAENPDVLLLMEVDNRWLEDLAELKDQFPYQVVAVRDEGYSSFGPFGMALMSRIPLTRPQTPRLGTADIPVTVATLEHSGREWTFIGVHPYPPVTPGCAEARNSLLSEVGSLAGKIAGPKVILGDLNTTRWSPHFRELSEAAGVRDSSPGFGYQPTWPDTAIGAVIPIDHVLISPEIEVIDRRVGRSIDSDHCPLVADLVLSDVP